MPTISQLYVEAWKVLKRHYWKSLSVVFIYMLIVSSVSFFTPFVSTPEGRTILTILNYVIAILIIPMGYGVNFVMFLNICRGEEVNFSYLKIGYKEFKRTIGTILLQTLYTMLWTLLLIVPGIVKSMAYAMTPFILHDNPELSYNAAIEKSMEIMQGYKMKFFLISIVYIALAIFLGVVTLGIGTIMITPIFAAVQAKFYQHIQTESLK